jgi:hypothetical protein
MTEEPAGSILNGEILFEMTDLGVKPKVIKDFFKPETFAELKKIALQDIQKATYDPLIARFGGAINTTENIEKEALLKIRESTGIFDLVSSSHYLVKYKIVDECIPSLWEHTDQNASQICLNVTIGNNVGWKIVVEGETFDLEENSAVVFSGQLHDHMRPNYPTAKSDGHVIQLFMEYVLPDHWAEISKIENNRAELFAKYGRDGDVRFFNRHRFFPLPDPPTNSENCKNTEGIQAYQRVLNYYEHIADVWQNHNGVETVDTTIVESNELFPGVEEFFISEESSKIICGLIKNGCNALWEKAKYRGATAANAYPQVRFIDQEANTCHPVDPLRRYYETVSVLFEKIMSLYMQKYPMEEPTPEQITLIRMGVGVTQQTHSDAMIDAHRVVSIVAHYNDSYDGGEFVFDRIGLTLERRAGRILVFPSNFLFNHKVNPVTAGVRYSSNRFYTYKTSRAN